MDLLDKGEVRLLGTLGNDLTVVASARVSNGVSLEEASKGIEADQKLINYLMKHRHGSPFEHVVFQFYIKAPIFVVREWMRHRISSYNEVSGRYTEFQPDFYMPSKWRVPGDSNKQGSRIPTEQEKNADWHINRNIDLHIAYGEAYAAYTSLLKMGVAKELARLALPLGTYTEFYWTINARSLMNFLSLRTGEDAQFEIREYAKAIEEEVFAKIMPMTWKAWNENGRIAP